MISLDGQDANEYFEPTEEDHAYFNALFAASDAIIFARENHELLVRSWNDLDPQSPDVNPVEGKFARTFRTKPRYAVTDSPADLEPLATPITGDEISAIADLRRKPDNQSLLSTGGEIFAKCLANGLVDEIEALVLPIVVGAGTSSLATVQQPSRLTRLELRPFDSGAFLVRYQVHQSSTPDASDSRAG